jgi:hypothetical protein
MLAELLLAVLVALLWLPINLQLLEFLPLLQGKRGRQEVQPLLEQTKPHHQLLFFPEVQVVQVVLLVQVVQ